MADSPSAGLEPKPRPQLKPQPQRIPRIVVGAPSSDSGKTTVVLALLSALAARGANPVSFKCGPDYIDPMFHSHVLGIPSYNLDLFLCGRGEQGADTVRGLFCAHAAKAGIAVIEGVMGFYDGVGVGSEASTYDLARTLDAPVVLVVSARGAARSLAATIRGFAQLEGDSHVAGVILNNCSKMLYAQLAPMLERECADCGVTLLGYLPRVPEARIESRHLGLVTAEEIDGLRERLALLGQAAEESIDWDALTRLAASAPPIAGRLPAVEPVVAADAGTGGPADGASADPKSADPRPVIAVARDKAFCFYYEDNLELLERCGARLVEFSPLEDAALPDGIDGLYLGGGYPELYESQLAENASMRTSVREALEAGLPCFAECGGFMYLLQELDGHPMVGYLVGSAHATNRLQRFGYVTITAKHDTLLARESESICAHEFHYWDSTANGDACHAVKPTGRSWECIVGSKRLWAGFPHIFLYGNPDFARRFVQAAADWHAESQVGRGGWGAIRVDCHQEHP